MAKKTKKPAAGDPDLPTVGRKPKKKKSKGCLSWPWSTTRLTPSIAAAISLFALLVRVLVSVGPYSGEASPPKFGDYEAQRHWMEITLHTPAAEWYRNTAANNLSYWGLDYPPLSAYQSLAHAVFLNSTVPESLALFSSRGFESPSSKRMMRWSVISSDLVVFFPAAIWFVAVWSKRRKEEDGYAGWLLAMILLNPAMVLIDHGHFQYNCISLGLVLGAIAAVLSGKEIVGSALFTLSINHKQMSMYYAPAFLSYLLGVCLRCHYPVLEIMKLGFIVMGTFAVVWWPYLYSVDAVMEVLARLAPFERGIYEDYVANFWCSTSMIIKWKRLFAIQPLKILSLIFTFSAFLPSFIQQIKAPSDRGFLYALLNSSFSFYLFSYQVHEKSILLPLLPASLLAHEEPVLFGWLMYYALLSMYPLLCRDKLILQYFATLTLFYFIYYSPSRRIAARKQWCSGPAKAIITLLLLSSFALHVIYLTLKPPEKYPFLFEALMMFLCFSQFVILAFYANIKQQNLLHCSEQIAAEKKNL